MHPEALITSSLFIAVFLALTALFRSISQKIDFPYTVFLLVMGLVSQAVLHYLNIETHLSLTTDLVYYVLLPILLFESAVQINAHQFRLQFKTISFLVTIGLLFSVFSIAVLTSVLIGLPFNIALLFGALISATDPIAVLALFKSVGAPKRLSLIADGESMFNDATGVIVFRVVSSFVILDQQFQSITLGYTLLNFLYVFFGSLVFGAILGYVTALFISQVQNDRLVEMTLTLALALGSFLSAEYFFHLSGVIATVAAAVVIGNVGRTKISGNVLDFMHELWEYFGFLAVSAVFFFATFNLHVPTLFIDFRQGLLIIAIVMVGRAATVYGSFLVTNHLPFFRNEPDVPFVWQHVLTWGGLRGVIPLVLVYSLPDDFAYKSLFMSYTFLVFLFTLFFQATTMGWLLKKLKLNVLQTEEQIIQQEINIFALEEAKAHLDLLPEGEFDPITINEVRSQLVENEKALKEILLKVATPKDFEQSLRIEALNIERQGIRQLFLEGHVTENVVFDFESELDLQQDALEYPKLFIGRGYDATGRVDSHQIFRDRLQFIRDIIERFPFVASMLKGSRKNLIFERFSLLQARILLSSQVIQYLHRMRMLMQESEVSQRVIDTILNEHEQHRLKNSLQMQSLQRDYQKTYQRFQVSLLESYAWGHAKLTEK